MLDGFSQGQGSNEALKIRNRINHVLGRLDNLVCDTLQLLTLMDTFDNKVCECEKREKGLMFPPYFTWNNRQNLVPFAKILSEERQRRLLLMVLHPAGAARGNQCADGGSC
ncbi:hypothetical protein NQ317_013457 [Molorchus minor]|uniref:Uncharacterized protein n=1 Tax=Molorchus minor TaxID=1323400 RepID=A0ABQ9J723_9CUCU|nr:hypothetical protein NQ317_013457 [Molorchus minor]